MNQKPRKKFTELDDINLVQIVNKMETPDWKKISDLMKKFSPRQCRDRYNNYLSPKVQNKKWTKEEDQILLEKYSIFGPKWSFLTRFFPNRAATNIKNHYAKLFSRTLSEKERKETKKVNQNKHNDSSEAENVKIIINENESTQNPECNKNVNFISDLDIDLQNCIDYDYLDFSIDFFSNEILDFI